jgi:hypothetical protein
MLQDPPTCLLISIGPEHSPTSTANNELYNGITHISAFEGTTNGTTSPADSLRDAGAGKVRGPAGRYVKQSKSPGDVKKGPNIKHVKKCMFLPPEC